MTCSPMAASSARATTPWCMTYVVKVLSPAAVTDPHGWYDVLATVPAATAFPAGSECRLSP